MAPNSPNRRRIFRIIEIAEHDQVAIRINHEKGINFFTQQNGFLLAQLRFIRSRRHSARLQMRGHQCKRVVCARLDIDLCKPAAYPEAAPIQEKGFVSMRPPRNNGEAAQHRHMDVRVGSGHPLRVRIA